MADQGMSNGVSVGNRSASPSNAAFQPNLRTDRPIMVCYFQSGIGDLDV